MSFICGVVAYKSIILSSFHADNWDQILPNVKYILRNVSEPKSFQDHRYTYHYSVTVAGLQYMVVGTSERITEAHKCLYIMNDAFVSMCGDQYLTATENSLDAVFGRQLEIILKTDYNDGHHELLTNVQNIIVHNLGLTDQRREEIDKLERRARDLEQESSFLLGNTNDLSQNIRWNQRKLWLGLGIFFVMVLVLLGVIVYILHK